MKTQPSLYWEAFLPEHEEQTAIAANEAILIQDANDGFAVINNRR